MPRSHSIAPCYVVCSSCIPALVSCHPPSIPLFRDPCLPFFCFLSACHCPFELGCLLRVCPCADFCFVFWQSDPFVFNLTACDSCFWVLALCYLRAVIQGGRLGNKLWRWSADWNSRDMTPTCFLNLTVDASYLFSEKHWLTFWTIR